VNLYKKKQGRKSTLLIRYKLLNPKLLNPEPLIEIEKEQTDRHEDRAYNQGKIPPVKMIKFPFHNDNN